MPLAAGPIVSLLAAWRYAFWAELPKYPWYQHTPDCDGEREQDQVLLLLLRHLVACKSKSCLLKLATSDLTSPNSVPCGVVTVVMDGEITFITLSAISANKITLFDCQCQNHPDITRESLEEKSFKERRVNGISFITE